MAIGELLNRVVLTEFRADTQQAQREVDRLIEKHSKLKQTAQDAARAQAAHFDQIVLDMTRSTRTAEQETTTWTEKVKESKSAGESAMATYAKVGIAIGVIAGGAHLAGEAIKEWSATLRLESQTAHIDIESLSESFSGLVNHHDLLKFAAQTTNGVLALSQKEMETLGRAAVALRDRGHDLEDSFKKLTDAAVKGKVGGLDDLGLSIEEGSSKAQTLKNMMTELNKVVAESGPAFKQQGDDVERLGVWWDNATAAVKRYSAEALVALAKPLSITEKIMEVKHLVDAGLSEDDAWAEINSRAVARSSAPGPDRTQQAARNQAALDTRKAGMDVIEMDDDDMSDDVKSIRDKRAANAKKLAEERKKLSNEVAKSLTDDLMKALELEAESEATKQGLAEVHTMLMDGLAQSGDAYQGVDFDAMIQQASDQVDQVDQINALAYEASKTRRTDTFLEGTFGPLEDFDVYQSAFESLTTAVGSSYEAFITGSQPAGQAFKRMFADMLMAMGKTSVVEGLKELAYAAGSLAFGNAAGAALHLKSAGLHAAVAVAAGAAAHAIGTSAQGAASDKAAAEKKKEDEKAAKGGGASSGGGDSGPRGRDVIVAYLDPFANQPEHIRRQQAREMISNVLGDGAVVNS